MDDVRYTLPIAVHIFIQIKGMIEKRITDMKTPNIYSCILQIFIDIINIIISIENVWNRNVKNDYCLVSICVWKIVNTYILSLLKPILLFLETENTRICAHPKWSEIYRIEVKMIGIFFSNAKYALLLLVNLFPTVNFYIQSSVYLLAYILQKKTVSMFIFSD